MNKSFKKFLISFSFVILVADVLFGSLCAMQNNQKVDFGKIIDVFYSALKTVKDLNYYTAEGVRFKILDRDVVFDFGFAGHGNLFTPINSISAKIVAGKDGAAIQASDDMTLSNLTKIVIENEIYKNGKDIDCLKWLVDCKLSPVQFFSFKFLILFNTTRIDGDWERLIEETFCLLFKLSQSKDVELINKNKRFSEYLPEVVKNILKESKFGLIEFIDDLWCVLTQEKSISGQIVEKPVQVKGFVFRDESFAKTVYEKIKDFSGKDLYGQMNLFVKSQGYDLVDSRDFAKFRSDMTDVELRGNEFVRKLIGYEEFLLSNNADKPAELINAVNALTNKVGFVFVSDIFNDEYWVAYVTQDVSFVNALKEGILILANSFREYLETKKTIFEGKDDVSLRYKMEFDAREKCRIELEKFAKSECSRRIIEDLKHKIDLIVNINTTSGDEQKKLDRVSDLEFEIVGLEKRKNEKNNELLKWQKIMSLQNGKSVQDIQDKIDAINFEISKLNTRVVDLKKELNQFKIGSTGQSLVEDEDIKKDEFRLAQLYKILDNKKAGGGVPSDKLLNAIKLLEQRVKRSAKQPIQVKSIDKKLEVREAVAKLLEDKVKELSSNLKSQIKELDLLSNFEDRVIQELLIDENVHLQKVFVARLEFVVAKIRNDNMKAKKLDAYRKAFGVVGTDQITDEKMQERSKLELEVGYIIDSESQEDFIAEIMGRESFLNGFIKDMTEHSDKFMLVRQRLQNSLTQILQNSSHFKNNSKLYTYLWRNSLPYSFKSFLNCVGISEKSFS